MEKGFRKKVENCPQDAHGPVASGIIDASMDKVRQNVEGAKTALEKLEKYGESSAGPSSGLAKFLGHVRKTRIGRAVKMNSISEALEKVKSCLDQALQEACNIELLLERRTVCHLNSKKRNS